MWIAGALLVGASLVNAQEGADTAPFPNTYYPGFADANTDAGAKSFEISPPVYPSPWADGSGGWEIARVQAQAFVSQLTLAEKVNLTTGVGWEGDRCVGNNGAIPRLAFRAMCMEDSPVGVRDTDFNSVFPAGVTIAATWDRSLFYQRGKGMGAEHYAKGVDVQLGPVCGPLGRSPEGGRNWEGFSPDPVLTGIAVAETVKGIQSSGVMACTKHYIAYEQEHFRQSGEYNVSYVSQSYSSNVDDVTMHELYLWPFADAVRAGTASIMCSYNQVNNSYACGNSKMLNGLLKDELGFQGFVMSDWSGQHSGIGDALAGLDMTMPGDVGFDTGNSYWGANLTIAVLNGSVPEWRIDDMATRIMSGFYYVGRDDDSPEPNFSAWTLEDVGPRYFLGNGDITTINEHVNVQGNHAAQIRRQAAMGTVLLKNTNNALPLKGTEKFTAIIGEDSEINPLGANGCSDRGCDMGTNALGWGSGTANFPFLISPMAAITKYIKNKGGADVQGITDNYDLTQIQTIASQATVSLVFVNTDSGEGYIIVDGNIGDRNNLTLWQNGEAIIEATAAVCPNTIVIVHSVGPILMTSWYDNENITAIVYANIPGEESGNSLVDVLYGAVNPGGKLPYTLGKTRESYGTDLLYLPNDGTDAPQINFAEGVFIDYRAFDKKNETPLYEFGFGLSYTTFSFSDLIVTAKGHSTYQPTTGNTRAAPVLGKPGKALSYLFPTVFDALTDFIYPFLTTTDLKVASGDPDYGVGVNAAIPANAKNGNAQPLNPAGGGPGGNPMLYDVLFTVSATITNTGSIVGDEVPQLYVGLGGPNDPVRVLRNFDRITIQPGASKTWTAELTRRDLSNWDTLTQNWVISSYTKTVYVGNSSRNLPLTAIISLADAQGSVAGAVAVESVTTSFAAAATS